MDPRRFLTVTTIGIFDQANKSAIAVWSVSRIILPGLRSYESRLGQISNPSSCALDGGHACFMFRVIAIRAKKFDV